MNTDIFMKCINKVLNNNLSIVAVRSGQTKCPIKISLTILFSFFSLTICLSHVLNKIVMIVGTKVYECHVQFQSLKQN